MPNIIASGEYWRVEDDGTLYIYCVGDMPNYYVSRLPWEVEDGNGNDVFERITSAVLLDGVTSVGSRAFYADEKSSSLRNVTIPNSVTRIADDAFTNCHELTSVVIPDSVTSIGEYAFHGCTSLTSVVIPDSVTSIGNFAFDWCENLESVTISNSITAIDGGAFNDCESLTSVVIPDSVTSIGYSAFYNCASLTSVTIPVGVTSIGNAAFNYCNALTDVYYGGTETQWNAITIGTDNAPLLNATMHYAPASPETPAEVTPAAPIAVPEITIGNIGNPLAAVASALNLLIRAFVQLRARLANVPDNATANAGTITGITMNGVSKGTSGVVDLGTVLTAHQDISGKVNVSAVGAANGVAELDVGGKVPSAQLPSYVDDVLEYASLSVFPATGETGKIYVAMDANTTYRWSGSAYVAIGSSLALGETSSTAYRGDRGKAAYDHAQTVTGNPHGVTKSDVGLGNVDNTSDANKPVSTATQTALNGKVDKVTGKGLSTEDYTTAEKSKLSGIASGATANVAATAAPLMDGTAAVGTSAKYAREDHRHPVDTSRASAADVAAIKALLQTAVLYRTASGNPATFSDGAAENLRKLVVTLAPTQSGSGDPYPPGGGNNLFHPTEQAWMSVDGMKNTDTTNVSGWVPVVAGETYTASAETAIYGIGMTFCSENSEGHPVGSSPRFNNINSASLTVVAPAGAAYAYLNMNANRTSAAATRILNGTDTTYLLKFERGSQRTPYANIRPISSVSSVTVTRADGNGGNSQSVTVALADGNNNPLAVYGGTLDVTAGTLSVTHAFYEFTDGSVWAQGQTGTPNQYYTASVPVAANNTTARNENFLCSHFTWASIWSGSTAYGISIYNSGVYFRNLSLFPTLADFSAWIDAQYANGTPLQVCYPINAPVTYQLTAQQLAALAGYNSVSADSGTLEVEYRADVGLSL